MTIVHCYCLLFFLSYLYPSQVPGEEECVENPGVISLPDDKSFSEEKKKEEASGDQADLTE